MMLLNKTTAVRAALAATLISLPVAAQVTHTGLYGSGASLLGRETFLPSAAFPLGTSVATPRYALPALNSIFFGSSSPSGGVAVDQTNGDIWTTSITSVFPTVSNGISRESNPNYRPTTTAAVSLAGILPAGVAVQGLAIDSTGVSGFGTKVLFLVDGTATLRVMTATIPPTVLAGPIALTGFTGQTVSGVGFDPLTGTIWVTSRQGRLANFGPLGAPTGLTRAVTGFTFPIVGCTVNSSTSAGFLAPPFCSLQNPGDFNVCVVDLAGNVFDSVTNRMIPGSLSVGETPFGLGSSADPQTLVGAGPNGIGMTLTKPLINTVVPSASLSVTNLTPGSNGVIAFDLCPLPVGIPVGSDTFWLNTASPSFITAPMASAGTTFTLSLAITSTALHGTQFTAQAAMLNPTLRLSNALCMTVGAP